MKTKTFTLLVIFAVLLLAACSGAGSPLPSTGAGQEQSIEGPCVDQKDGVELLVNTEDGYCLLYPTGHDLAITGGSNVSLFVDTLLNTQDPRLQIQVEDAAGRTSEQAASEIAGEFEGFELEQSSLAVAGEQALVLDNLPGQELSRQVILVHDGRLYRLSFTPADRSLGEPFRQMEELYTTVTESFSFLPQQ